MSLKLRSKPNKQLIHWLVLLSLLLGQFALGFGYGIAAEQNNDEIRIPVCTSTGIQYIIWTPEGIKEEAQPGAQSAAGSCTLCTVSPHQLRFDLHDTLLPKPLARQTGQSQQTAQLTGPTPALNPLSSPRAPPYV